MKFIKQFSEHKALTHRWLFLTQIFSPILMYIGARTHLPFLTGIGLVFLIAASLVAIFTK